MDFNDIVESVLKLGLVPTLLIVVLYFYHTRTTKIIKYLEEQNRILLQKFLEKESQNE
jgi:hypothetical protein